MANTTFSGPVRSENGFQTIVKSSTTGDVTNTMTFSQYTATVTVANGQRDMQQVISIYIDSAYQRKL